MGRAFLSKRQAHRGGTVYGSRKLTPRSLALKLSERCAKEFGAEREYHWKKRAKRQIGDHFVYVSKPDSVADEWVFSMSEERVDDDKGNGWLLWYVTFHVTADLEVFVEGDGPRHMFACALESLESLV